MEGQPAGSRLRAHDRVRHAGRKEDPVAGGEVEPFAADLQHGRSGKDDDPLVVVLLEVGAVVVRPAQDLFDDQVAVDQDLLEPLTAGRCLGRSEQPSPSPVRRNL